MVRRLIVNADDLGLDRGVNAGIAAARDRGIVTSASLMVRRRAAIDGARIARARPDMSIGLHVDLGEWVYVDGVGWEARDVVVEMDDAPAVIDEVERQLETFVALMGRQPTHLDGHQHVQRHEPVASVLGWFSQRLGVPLRSADRRVVHRGDFHGQSARGEPFPAGVTPANLVAIIAGLADGWTELGCHPGLDVDPTITTYADERRAEVAALCSVEARTALHDQGVVLASFADL